VQLDRENGASRNGDAGDGFCFGRDGARLRVGLRGAARGAKPHADPDAKCGEARGAERGAEHRAGREEVHAAEHFEARGDSLGEGSGAERYKGRDAERDAKCIEDRGANWRDEAGRGGRSAVRNDVRHRPKPATRQRPLRVRLLRRPSGSLVRRISLGAAESGPGPRPDGERD